LEWYYDALPTNCVADWVCPAGTGIGYLEYSCTEGPEIGYKNLAAYLEKRPVPPFLVASTLLGPGYVDEQEVENIAKFIASLDKNIPYSLLAFHPHFYMDDLPTTSRNHAFGCLDIARKAGLKRVRIGNIHFLGETY